VTTDPNVVQLGQYRIFIQEADNPSEAFAFYGCVAIDGLSQDLGDVTPVYCPSPSKRNAWEVIDTIPATPSLPTYNITQHADRFLRDIWWSLKERGCRFNVFITSSNCSRPDDINDWDGGVLLPRNRLTTLTLPSPMNPLSGDGNEIGDLTGAATAQSMDRILAIDFEEQADSVALAEIVDGLFNDAIECGDCGAPSDGCEKSYWLQIANSGSPGLSSQIVYSTDGQTWAAIDIPTLGGASGTRIAAVGNNLVVISSGSNSHHYSSFDDIDAGTVNWSEVGAGTYVGNPQAIYSKSSSETFVVGLAGYIYLITDPALVPTILSAGSVTTQNFRDIDGEKSVIVAVGENGAVVVSENSGETWYLLSPAAFSGKTLNAVAVRTPKQWFVGTGDGELWYTLDGGAGWSQISLPASINVINDIKFVEGGANVGYMACQSTDGTGKIYRTISAGNAWYNAAPYIDHIPTAERYNVVAPCPHNNNIVGIGGRVSVGGDGVLAIAS